MIEEKTMLDLPLNGRSYIDLLSIQAGVAPETEQTLQQGHISVNGQREASNAFLVNGGDVSEGRNMGTGVIPNLDSIAEFRLITNSFDAEYGRFSGAVMNAITKSGTNGFHGTVFEFLRNSDLDARGFFDPNSHGAQAQPVRICRGRACHQEQALLVYRLSGHAPEPGIIRQPAVVAHASRSAAAMFSPSDLSGVRQRSLLGATAHRSGWDIRSRRTSPTARRPARAPRNACFPSGVIPTSASRRSPANCSRLHSSAERRRPLRSFRPAQVDTLNDDKIGAARRFINKKTGNWYAYYHFNDSTPSSPAPSAQQYGNFGTDTPQPRAAGRSVEHAYAQPTAVNEARVGFHAHRFGQQPADGPEVSLSSLGFVTGAGTLGIINSGPDTWQSVPPISLSGQTGLSFGRSNQRHRAVQQHVASRGHLLENLADSTRFKFGGEFRYLQINERNIYAPNGNFTFDGSETGYDFADFLLGAPSQYIQASFQVLDSRTRYGGAFAQDSWRVTPNFTVNYGLRWEVSMPWYDTQNKIETIVPGVQSTRLSRRADGLAGAGRSGTAGRRRSHQRSRPPRGTISRRGLVLAWSPNVPAEFSASCSADPERPASAPRRESTTPRFRTPGCLSKSPTLHTGCFG